MTGGQIVALIFAILLLLPGGGLRYLGIHMQSAVDPIGRDYGWMFLAMGPLPCHWPSCYSGALSVESIGLKIHRDLRHNTGVVRFAGAGKI